MLLFGSLWMKWYELDPHADMRFPNAMPYLHVWPTAWHVFTVVDIALAALAVLALRYRAAAAVALVIVLARMAFPVAGYLDPGRGAGLALAGASLALFAPRALPRLGALVLLGSLFAPWYASVFRFVTRGASGAEQITALRSHVITPWEALAFVDYAVAAIALAILARPGLARFLAPLAIALIVWRMVETPGGLELAYGAWIALAGSILAAAGGLMSVRPKITDQCSPATRSSTSPASPASS